MTETKIPNDLAERLGLPKDSNEFIISDHHVQPSTDPQKIKSLMDQADKMSQQSAESRNARTDSHPDIPSDTLCGIYEKTLKQAIIKIKTAQSLNLDNDEWKQELINYIETTLTSPNQ